MMSEDMKDTLKLEQLAILALAVNMYASEGSCWLNFAIFFFAPDLAMVGYLRGPKVGAFCYNLLHHQGLAIGLILVGTTIGAKDIAATGLILLSHSAFDRVAGYGLKFADSFHHTHLGMIGPKAKEDSTLQP